MKKRGIIAFVLMFALSVTFGSVLLFAETDVWDGTAGEGFESKATGEAGNPIVITTGAELAFISAEVALGETFEGIYFKLGNDIDLNGKDFIPIGGHSKDHYFSGNFNGAGHKIKNLRFADDVTAKYEWVGLFGSVRDGIVRNLTVEIETDVIIKMHFGAVAGLIYNSQITNCHAEINSRIIAADPSATTIYVGGAVGYAQKASVISDCSANGAMHLEGRYNSTDAPKRVTLIGGGLMGRANTQNGTAADTVIVKNSLASVNISTGVGFNIYLGGFMGVNNTFGAANTAPDADAITISFENCATTGNLTLSGTYDGGANIGGFMAYEMAAAEMKNCYHSGSITASEPTSGITGAVLNQVTGITYSKYPLSTHTDCTTSYTAYGPASAQGVFTNCIPNVSDISEKITAIKATIAANFEADKAATEAIEAAYTPPQQQTTTTAAPKQTTTAADDKNGENKVTTTAGGKKSGCKSSVTSGSIIALALVGLSFAFIMTGKKRAKAE